MPGFHCILVVRDEGDIVAQTLAHLLSWCDSLSVYDTGSSDGTWEIVRGVAGRDRRVRALGSEPVLFTNGLRAWVFDRERERFREGDWIARVDADEFYHVPPPVFVRERVARHEGCVCTRQYDFVLTRSELRAWQEGRETVADRARPIQERRRFFRYDDYPEVRLFRYRDGMRWSSRRHDPFNPGLVAQERIPVLHYRARDPLQVQMRCALREPIAGAVTWAGTHWRNPDWRSFVRRDGEPGVVHWGPGEPLPERPSVSHVSPPTRRLIQNVLYRTGLVRCVDGLRPRFPAGFVPTPIPRDVRERAAANVAAVHALPLLRNEPAQLAQWKQRPAERPLYS